MPEQAPRAFDREAGEATRVSEITNFSFTAPRSLRDEIPKRIQANYVSSRRQTPRWKFWAR